MNIKRGPSLESTGERFHEPLKQAQSHPIALLFHPGVGLGLQFPELQGCTAELCGLDDRLEELAREGIRVFGVSTLTSQRNKQFTDYHNLGFEILSDPCAKLGRLIGVKTRRVNDLEVYERQTAVVRYVEGRLQIRFARVHDRHVDSILQVAANLNLPKGTEETLPNVRP